MERGPAAPGSRLHAGQEHPTAGVMRLQQLVGNRATGRLLQRNGPTGVGGGAAKRTIVLDGSVFDQINRGNKAVADKLRELLRTADVYMSHAAYQEAVTNRAIPRLGAATKLAIDELHIKITPPAKADVLADVRARNTVGSTKTVITEEDVLVAADAKNIGGEVFSPDGVFRENAGSVRKTVGVAVAPESERLAPMGAGTGKKPPPQDYRVGRQLLGLPEVEISLTGTVTPPKTPSGGGGTGGSGGGATPKGEPHVAGGGGTVTHEPGKAGVSGGAGAGEVAGEGLGTAARMTGRAILADGVAMIVVVALFSAAKAWLGYEKNVGNPEEEAFRRLLGAKVQPKVDEALKKRKAEAEQMTNDHPEFTVYAIVTMDLDYEWEEWGVAGHPTDKHVSDARYVDLRLSFKKEKQTEKVVDKDHWSVPMSDETHYIETSRVTYAVELDFGETPEQKEWRMFLHEAEQAVKRGMSARAIAEHSHFDPAWTPADEREEQRRKKWGEPSLRVEREHAARKRFVEAYIEYTFMHDLDAPWKAAIDYLHELEKRDPPRPQPPKPGPTGSLSEKDKKALADWIAKSSR